MSRMNNILVATDLSGPARQAADRAARLARSSGAQLRLVHALNAGVVAQLQQLLGLGSALEQTLVDRAGHERRSEASSTADAVTELSLPPGEPVVLGLLEFDAPADVGAIAAGTDASASVLAVRYVFDLELLSGDLTVEERSLPAMRLAVAAAERAWIAADLPQELVTPEDFREAVRTGVLDREELLRLAVRVPSERRDEALRGVAGELDRLGLDALSALAPSLRWISGDSRLGDDPTAWRTWIDARLAAGAPEEERGSRLDLPSPEHAR